MADRTPPSDLAAERATWDTRFKSDDYVFGTAPNAFLARQRDRLMRFPAPARVLSVADGEGRNSVWMAEQGLQVTAFDLSPVGVAKAERLAATRGVKVGFEVGDVYGWRWPAATYDAVVAIFVQFADPPMRAFMFERMAAACKPGGLVIIEGYTPKQLVHKTGGPGILENLYTAAMLRDAFKGCEILELREYEAELNEGARHAGTSAIVDFVGRKPLS